MKNKYAVLSWTVNKILYVVGLCTYEHRVIMYSSKILEKGTGRCTANAGD